eukprot:5581663-Lingulodinium_polyedra.AAC.1
MAVRRLQIILATQYTGAPRQTRVTAPLPNPSAIRVAASSGATSPTGSQPCLGSQPLRGRSPSGVAAPP